MAGPKEVQGLQESQRPQKAITCQVASAQPDQSSEVPSRYKTSPPASSASEVGYKGRGNWDVSPPKSHPHLPLADAEAVRPNIRGTIDEDLLPRAAPFHGLLHPSPPLLSTGQNITRNRIYSSTRALQ
ncbi:hypothetical protein VDGL01_10385 [Verticillium dahliae]